MILTGICKEKFLEWMRDKYSNAYDVLNSINPIILNALIIEFFDSVGIYIDIRIEFDDSNVFKTFDAYAEDAYVGNFTNRSVATIQAIKKSNDIYNNTDKV